MKHRSNAKHVRNEQPIGDQKAIVEDGRNQDAHSRAGAPSLLRIFFEESLKCGRERCDAPSLCQEGLDCFECD
jgi:hypothetical protein